MFNVISKLQPIDKLSLCSAHIYQLSDLGTEISRIFIYTQFANLYNTTCVYYFQKSLFSLSNYFPSFDNVLKNFSFPRIPNMTRYSRIFMFFKTTI